MQRTNLIDALQEYEPGEIWAQRSRNTGDYAWNSPAQIRPTGEGYQGIEDGLEYVCSSDYDRSDSLKVSAAWAWDDKLTAIAHLNDEGF